MNLSRPYIPMSVRVAVAERQVAASGSIFWPLYQASVGKDAKIASPWSLGHRLRVLLNELFPADDYFVGYNLDHDPALVLRKFNKRTGCYSPAANDPAFLIYRRKDDHQQKTTGRKPGAERTITTKGSDIGLKTKFARLERKKRHVAKPKGFASGRKISSRPFSKRKK